MFQHLLIRTFSLISSKKVFCSHSKISSWSFFCLHENQFFMVVFTVFYVSESYNHILLGLPSSKENKVLQLLYNLGVLILFIILSSGFSQVIYIFQKMCCLKPHAEYYLSFLDPLKESGLAIIQLCVALNVLLIAFSLFYLMFPWMCFSLSLV